MKRVLFGLCVLALFATSAAYPAGDLKIDTACAPGVSFWSLLGEVGIGYADGHLHMEKLYAVCLPQPKAPGDSNYAYSPEQGGKLATVIKSADGQSLGTYVWPRRASERLPVRRQIPVVVDPARGCRRGASKVTGSAWRLRSGSDQPHGDNAYWRLALAQSK